MRVLGIYATAIILPVQSVFVGEFYAAQKTAAFFKIARQKLNAETIAHPLAYLVYKRSVFVRRYGKRGTKIAIIALFGNFCGFVQTQFKALFAPFSALGGFFVTLCDFKKLARLKSAAYKLDFFAVDLA